MLHLGARALGINISEVNRLTGLTNCERCRACGAELMHEEMLAQQCPVWGVQV